MSETINLAPPPTTSLRPLGPGEQTLTVQSDRALEKPPIDANAEALTIVGLLVLCGLVWRVPRLRQRRGRGAVSELASPEKLAARTPVSAAGLRARRPAPFDRATAKRLSAPKVLQGSAWVTDGDTIQINKTQIRLFGIDAPELDHPYGKKAKWALVKLCKGHKVRAEITETDDFGRSVAKCTLPDGRDLSAEPVKLGLAIDWPKFSGGKYAAFETAGVRKKLWLADARQKGRMHVWKNFEKAQQRRDTRD